MRLAGEHAEPQGELAVTAPVVFGRLHVLPVVVEFLTAYPRVTARMLLVDRVVDLGIARVLSYQAEASLNDGSLRLILEAYEPEAIPVSLVHREDRLPQAKVQSFIALAVSRLRKQLKGLDRTKD